MREPPESARGYVSAAPVKGLAPLFSAPLAPGLGAHENINLYSGNSIHTSEQGVPEGPPSHSSWAPIMGVHRSRLESAPEEQSGGLLMD